uniref:Uncharacterized protein n=1 Tax=Arundo donax TaxID=35708 RepID=A0A0A9H5A3_ARUDO
MLRARGAGALPPRARG